MKRFVWRLEKVLEVKTREEQVRRMELFRLAEQLAQKRTELFLRRRVLQDLMAGVAQNAPAARLHDQELLLKHAAVDDAQIRRLQDEVAGLEVRQKQKRAEVLAARRFKEGLEKLRAQAKEQFIREQEKLDQKELDDRTTIGFARRAYMSEEQEMTP
jgi:flagellar biosynthesis chaperone FliJ